MKSDRRHQLERNELADRLGTGVQAVQPVLPMIMGAIAVIIVVSIGWGIYSTTSNRSEAAAWTDYYFNITGSITRSSADSYLDVAEAHPNSSAAAWARLSAGESYLQQGTEAIYQNRAEGEELIGQAIEAFESAQQSGQIDEVRSKAVLGLAQSHETIGDIEKAIELYQQYLTLGSSPPMLAATNDRIAFLSSTSGKEFYAWFSALDPKPDSALQLPSDMQLPPAFNPGGLEFGADPGSSTTPPPPQAEIDPSQLPAIPNMEVSPQGSTNPDEVTLPEAGASDGESGNTEGEATSSQDGDASATESGDNTDTP